MRNFLYFTILIFAFSCSEVDQNAEDQITDSAIEEWFPSFPDKPFKNLEFHTDRSEAAEQILRDGFSEKNDNFHFIDINKQVEVIFAESDKLTIFKVVFIDQNESFYHKINVFFDEKALKSNKNNDFSVYSFEAQNALFDVTIFNFENMIRLHFKPKTSH